MGARRSMMFCEEAGCATLVRRGRCDKHARQPFASATRSSTLYGTSRWKRERAAHLALNPRCRCGAPANTVDHEPPHRGDATAFFDRNTYIACCKPCHDAKTGRETRERVAKV